MQSLAIKLELKFSLKILYRDFADIGFSTLKPLEWGLQNKLWDGNVLVLHVMDKTIHFNPPFPWEMGDLGFCTFWTIFMLAWRTAPCKEKVLFEFVQNLEWHYATRCFTTLHHTTPHHTTPHYTTLHHTTPHHTTPHYTTLHHTTQHHTPSGVPHHSTQHHHTTHCVVYSTTTLHTV